MAHSHKIGLIGGSGFIGTKLAADLWHGGHFVSIADIKPNLHYPDFSFHGDVRNSKELIECLKDCDCIINLAAVHHDNVQPISLYYDVNVTGALNTCAAAEALGIQKIIFTSSAAVYGHDTHEADENSSHHPIGPYGDSKSKAEDVYKAWAAKDPNRSLTIVRPTVVFGPANRGNVHVLLNQIATNKFIMIGNGENKKSMAYVDNVAAFLCHCLNFGPGVQIFNYVDKPDLSMNELVSIIRKKIGKDGHPGIRLPKIFGQIAGSLFDMAARLTGKSFPISRVRVEKFCATTVFSAEKLKTTAFTPPLSLKQGLELTIESEFSPKA